MHSTNGENTSHDPRSMGIASFESHATTSTSDLPMTWASFQHSRYVRSLHLFYSSNLALCDTSILLDYCRFACKRTKTEILCVYSLSLSTRQPSGVCLKNKGVMVCLFFISHCICCRLCMLDDVHGSYKALFSSMKSVYDLMVCRASSTQNKHCSLTDITIKQQQQRSMAGRSSWFRQRVHWAT